MSMFYQTGPKLSNTYTSDRILQLYLKTHMPRDVMQTIESDLVRFGERMASDVYEMGLQAERELPEHVPFDPWGNRVDEIRVSNAWTKLERVSAEEGLVAIAYERKLREYSRIYQHAKLYLFHPSSAYYSCPLAMTDGAAKLIESHGDEDLRKNAFRHLISRDPKFFWTSGQWMTERSGGSDISGTETVAQHIEGDEFLLSGDKWFTSATTSQMAMTLANVEGTKGLSLFYLELRDEDKRHLNRNGAAPLNGIEILRLKEKLGTKALPTAELRLNGTRAKLVGEVGHGVRTMSTLFNITRIDNAICAVSTSQRTLALLNDYSNQRLAFRKKLIEQPLHRTTMANLYADFVGSFLLVFKNSSLLGQSECSDTSNDINKKLLRLLTPVAKLFTAKINTALVAEGLEGFGGAGYVEDVGVAKHYRDGIVLSIWEGTTNVLSLDIERAILKDDAWQCFTEDVRRRLASVQDRSLATLREKVDDELADIDMHAQKLFGSDSTDREVILRRFAMNIARIYTKSLILEFADKTKTPEIRAVAENWQERHLLEDLSRASDIKTRSNLILSYL